MMIKRTIKISVSCFVALTVFWGGICCYSNWLDKQLEQVDDKKVLLNNGIKIKDKGLYLLQRSLRHGDLILVGSSELASDVPQNPINMFPNNDLPVQINKVGKAHRQSLLDGIMLGSLPLDESSKVSLVVSMQWFFDKDIDKKGTQANFSELQYYAFMRNDAITDEEKVYVSQRLSTLLDGGYGLGAAFVYAKLHSSENVFYQFCRTLINPYYEAKYTFLLLKDKYQAYKFLSEAKEDNLSVKQVDWDQAQIEAGEMGHQQCTNNKWFVMDSYYSKYIGKSLNKIKDRYVNTPILKSKEKDDYLFLLEIANRKRIKPYMIFTSCNGWYYDYTGIDKSRRAELYDWLAQATNNKGIEYLDIRDYEYEPYFYKDVMHLGWKGWIYVSRKISQHYK